MIYLLEYSKEINILEADKGNVSVAMKRRDYEDKIQIIVNDMMTYKSKPLGSQNSIAEGK